jgi:hypothetical protein
VPHPSLAFPSLSPLRGEKKNGGKEGVSKLHDNGSHPTPFGGLCPIFMLTACHTLEKRGSCSPHFAMKKEGEKNKLDS